ncbi:hypothetical protein GCM10022419_033540 [Nonomuraea rosea]|uniref:Uncharacterized protein n=1 Tax=Nonomuraea rosea TaxID=638574 RepID=A0ABP6WKL9_9ACTN
MNECVICNDPTDNTQQARIGDKTGPCCPDCAEWCDGNLIEA